MDIYIYIYTNFFPTTVYTNTDRDSAVMSGKNKCSHEKCQGANLLSRKHLKPKHARLELAQILQDTS